MNEIGVFINSDDKISDFFNSKSIKVFEKDTKKWHMKKEIPLDKKKLDDINSIREYFIELVTVLESCKSIIVSKAIGIPYNIFSMYDYSIWELDGNYNNHLENIYIKELEIEMEEVKKEVKQVYEQLSEGYYFIDLIELQLKDPEVSSKKAIRPFLKSKDFQKLDVRCCHVPAWIEKEVNNNMKININKLNKNEYILTVLR